MINIADYSVDPAEIKGLSAHFTVLAEYCKLKAEALESCSELPKPVIIF